MSDEQTLEGKAMKPTAKNVHVRINAGTTPKKFSGKVFRAVATTYESGRVAYEVNVGEWMGKAAASFARQSDLRMYYRADEVTEVSEIPCDPIAAPVGCPRSSPES